MVFSLKEEYAPVPGCTVSGEVMAGVVCFSMARGTDISPEIYPDQKLYLTLDGGVQITGRTLRAGDCLVTAAKIPVGARADENTVFTEITLRRNTTMNEAIKAGEVFRLAELVPYQTGKIVNMDVCHNDTMKLAVMAFDAGTGLSEHAAPGDALIFALDGEAVIGYEGGEYPIRAGENFRFAKGGLHSVKADKRFKMALMLVLK